MILIISMLLFGILWLFIFVDIFRTKQLGAENGTWILCLMLLGLLGTILFFIRFDISAVSIYWKSKNLNDAILLPFSLVNLIFPASLILLVSRKLISLKLFESIFVCMSLLVLLYEIISIIYAGTFAFSKDNATLLPIFSAAFFPISLYLLGKDEFRFFSLNKAASSVILIIINIFFIVTPIFIASRAGYFLLYFTLLPGVLLYGKSHRKQYLKRVFAALLSSIMLISVFCFLNVSFSRANLLRSTGIVFPFGYERLQSSNTSIKVPTVEEFMFKNDPEMSNNIYKVLWEQATEDIKSHPLLGSGKQMFPIANEGKKTTVHNMWLESMLHWGIVGTSIFLVLILSQVYFKIKVGLNHHHGLFSYGNFLLVFGELPIFAFLMMRTLMTTIVITFIFFVVFAYWLAVADLHHREPLIPTITNEGLH